MKIQLDLDYFELKDGTFKPHFSIIEWMGDKMNHRPYNIFMKEYPDSREDALKIAKKNGIEEIVNLYGEDVEFTITYRKD